MKFTKISPYWHLEWFIIAPWMVWFSYKVWETVDLLKVIAQ